MRFLVFGWVSELVGWFGAIAFNGTIKFVEKQTEFMTHRTFFRGHPA